MPVRTSPIEREPVVSGGAIAAAVRALRAGGLVGLPTETVYGLAADAESPAAVARIFAVKGRPAGHPLIVHLARPAEVDDGWAVDVPPEARRLAAAFWPGPLTLVLRRGPRVTGAVTGGQESVALRVPSHPVAHAVLAAFGGGLAAPSANPFGKLSPTTARAVREGLGDAVDLVLEGGPSAVGLESTIVACTGTTPAILRLGAVTRDDLERVLGVPVTLRHGGVRAPGMLAAHYAPRASVLPAGDADAAEIVSRERRRGRRVAWLAAHVPGDDADAFAMPDDAERFAAALYETLRDVDRRGYDAAVVVPPEGPGIAEAIRDRIGRAAAAAERDRE